MAFRLHGRAHLRSAEESAHHKKVAKIIVRDLYGTTAGGTRGATAGRTPTDSTKSATAKLLDTAGEGKPGECDEGEGERGEGKEAEVTPGFEPESVDSMDTELIIPKIESVDDIKEVTAEKTVPKSACSISPKKMTSLVDAKRASLHTVGLVAKSTADFCFDVRTTFGLANPGYYKVSDDLKTAQSRGGPCHIVLSPKVSAGLNTVIFRVERKNGPIYIAVVENCDKPLREGVRFDDLGRVHKDDRMVATRQPFGRSRIGWQNGDRIIVTADFTKRKISIKSPYGEFQMDWKSSSTGAWFAFGANANGCALSIES